MLVGEDLFISEGSSDSSSTQQTEEETTVEEPAAETTSQEDQPAAEDTEESSSTSSGQRQTYTIQEGDSLWDIAIEFDVSVETLTDLNPEVSRTMLVGEELIISDGSAPAEESSDDTAGEQSSEEEQPTEEQSSGEDTTQTEEDTTQTEETATTIPEDAVVTFVQSIRVEEGLYPVSSIESLDAINAKLDTVVEGEQTYTIQEGDSPSLVADKVGIPTQTLIDLNPEVTQTMLQSVQGDLDKVTGEASALMQGMQQLTGALYNPENPSDTNTVAGAVAGLSAGADQLDSGVAALAGGANQLKEGTARLDGGAAALTDGLRTLAGSSKTVQSALGQFESGAGQLNSGMQTLQGGVGEYVDQVQQAVSQLDPESLAEAAAVADALREQANAYTGYAGSPKGARNTTKFVMKTAAPVKQQAEQAPAAPEKEQKSFWQRLRDLF